MTKAALIARFNEKRRVDRRSGCWIWLGAKKPSNVKIYGGFHDGAGGFHRAHRFAWQLHNGPIPDGLCVLHKCDNSLCVNPKHLFLGTNYDNMRDMVAKGRHRYGPNRPSAQAAP